MTDMTQRAAKTIAEAISLMIPDPNAPPLNLRNQASRRDLATQMLAEGLRDALLQHSYFGTAERGEFTEGLRDALQKRPGKP